MSELWPFGRRYDLHEIVADGIVHGVGIAFALVGATALIFYVTLWGSLSAIAAAWIYALGLILCLSISFTYNIWPHSRAKWLLRRLDPLIALTLAGIWMAALGGIFLKCFYPGRYDRLAILLYLGMGWSGVMVAEPLSNHLAPITMWLIVIGGMIYSMGVIFHVWERLRFQNAIWHGFVVVAAAVHYSAVMTSFSLTPVIGS